LYPAKGDVAPAPAISDEDLGFLDHMVNMEDGFSRLGEIVTEVGRWTEEIGSETARVTNEVESAKANQSSGTARHIQKLARRLAEHQNEYGKRLATANEEYSNLLSMIESSLEYVIGAQEPSSAEDKRELSEFLDVLAHVEESAVSGRTGFVGMAAIMDQLPKMERHLNRATQFASTQVKRLVENIEQTIAIISRARGVGQRVLRFSPSTAV
jgi:Sec-independent protein translocase protein TatA